MKRLVAAGLLAGTFLTGQACFAAPTDVLMDKQCDFVRPELAVRPAVEGLWGSYCNVPFKKVTYLVTREEAIVTFHKVRIHPDLEDYKVFDPTERFAVRVRNDKKSYTTLDLFNMVERSGDGKEVKFLRVVIVVPSFEDKKIWEEFLNKLTDEQKNKYSLWRSKLLSPKRILPPQIQDR